MMLNNTPVLGDQQIQQITLCFHFLVHQLNPREGWDGVEKQKLKIQTLNVLTYQEVIRQKLCCTNTNTFADYLTKFFFFIIIQFLNFIFNI